MAEETRVLFDATGRTVKVDDLCRAAKWVVAGALTFAEAREWLVALATESR